MGKAEAKVEDYLRDRVKALGGWTRKVKWIGRRGAPDQFVGLPRWQWHGLVECKSEDRYASTTAQQDNEIDLLRACGVNVYVIRSREQVDELLRRIENGN